MYIYSCLGFQCVRCLKVSSFRLSLADVFKQAKEAKDRARQNEPVHSLCRTVEDDPVGRKFECRHIFLVPPIKVPFEAAPLIEATVGLEGHSLVEWVYMYMYIKIQQSI